MSTRCIRFPHHPHPREHLSRPARLLHRPRTPLPGSPVTPPLTLSFVPTDNDNDRPMIGCTGNFQDQFADPNATEQDVYIHGYVSGRVFRSGKDAEGEGLPITVAATFLDGLVLSLTPFHNSCNYRSAVVYGYATLVEDKDEALYAMKLITDNLLPGRWDGSRVPPTQAELNSTSILRVRVSSGTSLLSIPLHPPCSSNTPQRPPKSAPAARAKTAPISKTRNSSRRRGRASCRTGAHGANRSKARRMGVKRWRVISSSGARRRRRKLGTMRLRRLIR
jgi:nitroimidazol reductase NimA-like FMN-containing flavoprotein (pyridoxamine 5'-phosphate oxidase superfamily)